MTDCLQNEIRDRLPEYVHGTLGSAERARVETHWPAARSAAPKWRCCAR